MAYVYGTKNSELIDAADGVTGGDDTIYGLGGNDTIYGLGGNDVIDGGLGADTMIGGTGSDAYFVDNPEDVVTEGGGRADGSDDMVYATFDYTLPTYVEHLQLYPKAGKIDGTGNALANTIFGNESDNTLKGWGGKDSLWGGGGDDTLIGGTGDDVLDGDVGSDKMSGGLDNDTYYIDNAWDTVSENADEGIDTVRAYFNGYSLGANLENLWVAVGENGSGNALDNEIYGNASDNVLVGNGGDDYINGAGGADKMYGGTGNDDYVVYDAGDVAIENAGEGLDTVNSTINYTLGANVENLELWGSSSINGTGNALDNHLQGNSWANILDGGAGIDVLEGLGGDDTYYLDTFGDQIVEGLGDTDWAYVSFTNYVLDNNVENGSVFTNTGIQLTGNSLDNDLYGAGGGDKLVGGGGKDFLGGGESADDLYGSSGDDTLSGDNGSDYINGGLNNDTLSGGFGGDHFVFINGDGLDTITDFVAGDLSGDYIELTGYGIASFTALQPSMSQVGADVVIDLGAGNEITLLGVTLASLNQGDFVFS